MYKDQDQDHAYDLLDRIGFLRHACDLDLLVFFARHPRTLLASEQLASLMGYALHQTAESLDFLLKSGLVTRTQNPTCAARMYVFTPADTSVEWLPPLLEFVSTRHGRLAMKRALAARLGKGTDGHTPPAHTETAGSRGPQPFRTRQSPAAAPERRWMNRRREER